METRFLPGSESRLYGGIWRGDEAENPYGRGQYDPVTGLWDYYEEPEEAGAHAGPLIGWAELIGQWKLLESDFHEVYGADLSREVHRQTWRWFDVRVQGLLAADTRLARHFAPDPSQE